MCDDCDDPGHDAYHVDIRRERGAWVIETDLRRAPGPLRGDLLSALSTHLNADVVDLTKGKADTDGRYRVLESLIARAKRDWHSAGARLVEQVQALLSKGPVEEDGWRALERIFEAHAAAVQLRFSGLGDRIARARAIDGGYVDPKETVWSVIDVGYRAGRGLDALGAASADASTVEATIRAAMNQPLTRSDEAALDFVRRNAALKMRRPLGAMHDAMREVAIRQTAPRVSEGPDSATPRPPGEPGGGATSPDEPRGGRTLSAEESRIVRATVARAVTERRTPAQLQSDLRDAVANTTLTNDMERVARTELRDAHAEGGYQALKQQAAAAGIDDPEVYKITSPTACAECVRIWGRGGSKRYRLSQVEAWEARGGNYGLPKQQWGPTIGTVHPNCACGPLLFFSPRTHRAAMTAADEILAQIRAEREASP